MEMDEPVIHSSSDSYTDIRAHWVCLREFFENWASKQDELLGLRHNHMKQFLETNAGSGLSEVELSVRDAEFRHIEGHCRCRAAAGHNSGKETCFDQVWRQLGDEVVVADTIDSECTQAPTKVLQAQEPHTAPSVSYALQSDVVRTSSTWAKAVLRPSDSRLWEAIENLRGTAEGRSSMNERWFHPEPERRMTIVPMRRSSGRSKISNTFEQVESLKKSIRELSGSGNVEYWQQSARLRGSRENSNGKSMRKVSSEKLSQIFEKRKNRSKQLDGADGDTAGDLPCLKRFVFSGIFVAIGGFTILVNAVLIAVETEYEASTLSTLPWSTTINMGLNIWYAGEMVLKMYAFRCGYFLGPDKRWNFLDMFLVIMSLVDMAFTSTTGVAEKHGMGRALRAVRLVRLVRNLRLVRFFNSFYNFQRMVLALTSCLGTLFWSVVMLACVTWSFAVCMTQFVSSLRRRPDADTSIGYTALQEYFGTTAVAMHCLIQSATAGLSWGTVSTLLFSFDASTGILYLCYIFLTIFGVLNVVTSVFVESALQTSQHYRELLVEQNRRNKEYYASHVREIFKVIDEDGSGLVSLPEIQNIFADPNLQEFIDALEVNATDADMLFNLLDYDGSGEIDADEFCDGCLRLKGEAKSFDVYCMIYENERNLRFSKTFMGAMADTFKCLATHVNFLTQKMKDPELNDEVVEELLKRRQYSL